MPTSTLLRWGMDMATGRKFTRVPTLPTSRWTPQQAQAVKRIITEDLFREYDTHGIPRDRRVNACAVLQVDLDRIGAAFGAPTGSTIRLDDSVVDAVSHAAHIPVARTFGQAVNTFVRHCNRATERPMVRKLAEAMGYIVRR